MDRPTLVLLDLEETVVDDWQSRNFLWHKMERVKRFLEQFHPFTLGLMSWAVWDDGDLRVFHDELEGPLSEFFGSTFEAAWSLDQWQNRLLKCKGLKAERKDMFDCFGKHETLFMCRNDPLFANRRVLLVDDVVEHGLSFTTSNNNFTNFVNVDKL